MIDLDNEVGTNDVSARFARSLALTLDNEISRSVDGDSYAYGAGTEMMGAAVHDV